MPCMIYHVCHRSEWDAAQIAGIYAGSTQDSGDGFIHFSARDQLEASVAKHRRGQDDLVILIVDGGRLGAPVRWEPARGGALFPHLYGALPLDAVRAVQPLLLGPDGRHRFPDLTPFESDIP